MATKTLVDKGQDRRRDDRELDYVSKQDGIKLLDQQARKYFAMSGQEFTRRYRSGALHDADRSKVTRVALLIPFTED